jgi:hypothetical protein
VAERRIRIQAGRRSGRKVTGAERRQKQGGWDDGGGNDRSSRDAIAASSADALAKATDVVQAFRIPAAGGVREAMFPLLLPR